VSDAAVDIRANQLRQPKGGGRPAGFAFVDNHDGTGTISGTPAPQAKSHTYHVGILVLSGAVTVKQILLLTVPGSA
jgi:hypothetical protein